MKQILAMLGLVLLAGCASEAESNCPRKDKGCGKKVAETSIEQKGISQEVEPTVESVASSK